MACSAANEIRHSMVLDRNCKMRCRAHGCWGVGFFVGKVPTEIPTNLKVTACRPGRAPPPLPPRPTDTAALPPLAALLLAEPPLPPPPPTEAARQAPSASAPRHREAARRTPAPTITISVTVRPAPAPSPANETRAVRPSEGVTKRRPPCLWRASAPHACPWGQSKVGHTPALTVALATAGSVRRTHRPQPARGAGAGRSGECGQRALERASGKIPLCTRSAAAA